MLHGRDRDYFSSLVIRSTSNYPRPHENEKISFWAGERLARQYGWLYPTCALAARHPGNLATSVRRPPTTTVHRQLSFYYSQRICSVSALSIINAGTAAMWRTMRIRVQTSFSMLASRIEAILVGASQRPVTLVTTNVAITSDRQSPINQSITQYQLQCWTRRSCSIY